MIVIILFEYQSGAMFYAAAQTISIKQAYKDFFRIMLANGEEWYWVKNHVWIYPTEVAKNAWAN